MPLFRRTTATRRVAQDVADPSIARQLAAQLNALLNWNALEVNQRR
jgi:hypothetical protein